MGIIFSKVVEMSMAATLLIVVVAIIRFPLKQAPKWFMTFLWIIVAIRLLVPVQIESHIGFLPDFANITKSMSKAIAEDESQDMVGMPAGVTVEAKTDSGLYVPAEKTDTATSAGDRNIDALVGLWICGMLMVLAYAVYNYFAVKKKVSASIRFNSKDAVYVCDEIDSPFIFGILRPVIFLPSGLSHETTENVLSHERAHIYRLDHVRKQIGFLVVAIHWFNPLVWLSYSLFCKDIELACDERAVKEMSLEEKKSYAHSLLDCSSRKRLMTVYPVAFAEVSVKTRVKQVFNYKKPSAYLLTGFFVLALALTTSSFTKAAEKVVVTPKKVVVEKGTYGGNYESKVKTNLADKDDATNAAIRRTAYADVKMSLDETPAADVEKISVVAGQTGDVKVAVSVSEDNVGVSVEEDSDESVSVSVSTDSNVDNNTSAVAAAPSTSANASANNSNYSKPVYSKYVDEAIAEAADEVMDEVFDEFDDEVVGEVVGETIDVVDTTLGQVDSVIGDTLYGISTLSSMFGR